MTELTPEEIANGWTRDELRAYQVERDKAANLVGGNIVTEYKRGKPAMRIEGAGRGYSPLTRQVR